MSDSTLQIGSPYFEDLEVGRIFDEAPSVTLTSGHAAIHQALFGDRLRLPLDAYLSRDVTGQERTLANPHLACNLAIGQTTDPSGRVMGNLFYRGLVFERPVFIGDTLRTTTKIVALRQNRAKPGRAASGMAVFEVHTVNQAGETVLHFWRCPMLPCRSQAADTGHADSFDAIPSELDMAKVFSAVPGGWDLGAFREHCGGGHFSEVREGTRFLVEGRDTVTCATEIARMTLNVARTHTDAAGSAYGKRLVYGGHTITMAASQVTRALPNLVTFIAWRSCDHTAPVFEGDILRSEFEVEAVHVLDGGGGLLDLRVEVFAERGAEAPKPEKNVQVLDWRVIALMA